LVFPVCSSILGASLRYSLIRPDCDLLTNVGAFGSNVTDLNQLGGLGGVAGGSFGAGVAGGLDVGIGNCRRWPGLRALHL
jgi:hypothetical protein